MPCVGLTPFLQAAWTYRKDRAWPVSMPCVGLTPFLHEGTCVQKISQGGFQCPVSGLLHFYDVPYTKENWRDMFQCPVSGLLHFYILNTRSMSPIYRFQCPVSGLLHFYWSGNGVYNCRRWVSMPCVGLTPFLHICRIHRRYHQEYVSMPCVGLTPFLQDVVDEIKKTNEGFNALCRAYSISTELKYLGAQESAMYVSMPCVGLTPFLRGQTGDQGLSDAVCFNALCRAYSISTLTRQQVVRTGVLFQCPVSGLLHFYKDDFMGFFVEIMVSMPCVGLTPFLLCDPASVINMAYGFQCPVSGLLHFYA